MSWQTSKKKGFVYFLVYLGIIIFATPLIIPWWYRIIFWLFASFLFLVTKSLHKEQIELSKKWFWLLFIWTIGVLFLTRIIPFLHFGQAPLGYDTGIYLRYFQKAIADHSRALLPLIVQTLSAVGFSQNQILHGFLVAFNIFLGLALYTVSKSIFRNRLIALSTFLLFVLSIAQYEAYIWMFYRMMIALVLFMITTALIARGSWLAILAGGFAGALHPATFLVFGIVYIMYLITLTIGRWWKRGDDYFLYAVVAGFGILVVALFSNFAEFRGYLPYLTEHKLQLASFDTFLSSELTGFYLNFDGFRASTLFYTPFALLGIWSVFRNIREQGWNVGTRNFLFLFSWLSVTLVLIVNRVIFYQRYLIILDILIIIFASVAFAKMVEYFKDSKAGRVLLAIFIVGFSGIAIYYSFMRESWIPSNELSELKATSIHLESKAYGMATDAYYTPWVYGYLTERTIAPGYFINYWSLEEWQKFWYKGTDKERFELLARYGIDPIYIFVGSKQAENKPMREFLSRNAVSLSEHIWRYHHQQN